MAKIADAASPPPFARPAGLGGASVDLARGAKLYLRAASRGHAQGKVELAKCHLYGWGVPRNAENGFFMTKNMATNNENTASKNFGPAVELLGIMYRDGDGVEQDLGKAAELFGRAVAMGVATAGVEYYIMQIHGRGLPQNPNDGVARLKSLAESGVRGAHSALGLCLEHGVAVPKNPQAAVQIYQQGYAVAGCPAAMRQLALAQQAGIGSFTPDDYAARQFMMLAARNRDVEAILLLGQFYERGIGGPVDKELAKECYAQAGKLGVDALTAMGVEVKVKAQETFAAVFDTPKRSVKVTTGGAKSTMSMAQLLEHLPDSVTGNDDLLAAVGTRMLFNETDATRDAGRILLTVLADRNCIAAMVALASAHLDASAPVELAPSAVFKMATDASAAGNVDGKLALAQCYERGVGVAASAAIAKRIHTEISKANKKKSKKKKK